MQIDDHSMTTTTRTHKPFARRRKISKAVPSSLVRRHVSKAIVQEVAVAAKVHTPFARRRKPNCGKVKAETAGMEAAQRQPQTQTGTGGAQKCSVHTENETQKQGEKADIRTDEAQIDRLKVEPHDDAARRHSKLVQSAQRLLIAHSSVEDGRATTSHGLGVPGPTRGIRLAEIELLMESWYVTHGVGRLSVEEQLQIVRLLFEECVVDDKQVGIMTLRRLAVAGKLQSVHLDMMAQIFDAGLVTNWVVCDSFCSRVLRVLVKGNADVVLKIVTWREAANEWRARASLVGLMGLVGEAEWHGVIRETIGVLVRRRERYVGKAVVSMLRMLDNHDVELVKRIVDEELVHLSKERLGLVMRKFSDEEKKGVRIKWNGLHMGRRRRRYSEW